MRRKKIPIKVHFFHQHKRCVWSG